MARAFAAEILALGATDADDSRRRAMLDPSPHPDLVWLRPRGAQHMVEEVREQVIRAASYRPFEAEKRVFVIEAAEQMRDESQNALLKTLEEPPDFVHLILLTAEPADAAGDHRLPLPTDRFRPAAAGSRRSSALRRWGVRTKLPPPPASPPATPPAPASSSLTPGGRSGPRLSNG